MTVLLLVSTMMLAILSAVTATSQCPHKCFCSKDLTSVNCGGKHFTEIPPDIPQQVQKLYLRSNKISAIPRFVFAKFTHLRYLDLRQNIISSVDAFSFASCPQLQTLYLTANGMINIHLKAFQGSHQVTFLNLGANRLKKIPSLPDLVNLQSLILEANKINNATFPESYHNNTALIDIVMSNNIIGSLDNKTFVSLRNATVKKVEISRSAIKTVESGTFLPLNQMMSLKIGYNPLDSTQLQNVIKGLSNTSLVSLDIRNLSLAGQLPSATFALLRETQIRYLKMPNNKIDSIPPGAFVNLPQLLLIDLSACHIQTISDVAFKNLSVLQILFLNDNNLAKVPRGLPSALVKLYLNNNHIDKVENEVFINLNILEELYLVENAIHELQENAFLGLSQLRKLHMGHNGIATLPKKLFNQFTRLRSLELNNNNIKVLPLNPGLLSSLTSLLYLNLDSNGLSSLPLDVLGPLQRLTYLHANNNLLGLVLASDTSGILFKGLAKLKELYLSNNGLDMLPEPMLAEQRLLQILNVSYNRISHWEKNLFVSTESLHTVDLSMNLISLINETSVSNLRSVKSLNLTGNPFACNCNARWFCGWMNKTNVKLPFSSQYRCNLPSAWQGKNMTTFCAAHIDCTDYTLYYIIVAVAGGCLVTLFLFVIAYRYRWYVRHRFYRMGKKLRRVGHIRKDYSPIPGEDKQYDIYLSYADEDMRWVAEHIMKNFDNGQCSDIQCEGQNRVCFRYRDFLPGRNEIGSMADSIPASRRVFIVATENYVRCNRCEFELDLVLHHHVEKEVDDYHLIVKGKLPLSVPKPIERMLQRNKYTEWLDKDSAEETFIERLADHISNK